MNLSNADIIAFCINKPNLMNGENPWISLVHLILLVTGIIVIVFASEIYKAFGCYAVLYGADFSIKLLTLGLCSSHDAPNIGSRHYTEFPLSTSEYVLIGIGSGILMLITAYYLYLVVQRSQHTHHVVMDDTEAVYSFLDKKTKTKTPLPHTLHFDTIYWWYLDILAYTFNVPNQVGNGRWYLTGIRIFMNMISASVYLFPNFYGSAYYPVMFVTQLISFSLYAAGFYMMHSHLEAARITAIQTQLEFEYGLKQSIPEITKAYNSARLRRSL
jgi:hypothetical protein